MSGIERVYGRRRTFSVPWWQLALNVFIGGILILQATANPYVSSRRWYTVALLVVVLVRIVLDLLYRRRGRTIVGAQGITAREALRTAERTWHDVYDIRAELNPNGRFENAEWTTYAYRSDGRGTRLPYFDDWQLPDFHTELADLRAASALHRGTVWELRPEVEDRIRRRARDRKVWSVVCIAAVFVLFAAFVFLA
ncbi:PH domain-containing protein [Streptomyces sp. NPDC101455]|uniref:PH domain-containing protein n=1 Tax=Streptomyces sp. NPDC101455 TaxID=3366142 RepID=UPI00382E211F